MSKLSKAATSTNGSPDRLSNAAQAVLPRELGVLMAFRRYRGVWFAEFVSWGVVWKTGLMPRVVGRWALLDRGRQQRGAFVTYKHHVRRELMEPLLGHRSRLIHCRNCVEIRRLSNEHLFN